jgi:hypothetical protein
VETAQVSHGRKDIPSTSHYLNLCILRGVQASRVTLVKFLFPMPAPTVSAQRSIGPRKGPMASTEVRNFNGAHQIFTALDLMDAHRGVYWFLHGPPTGPLRPLTRVWRRFTASNTSVAAARGLGLHGLSTGPPRGRHGPPTGPLRPLTRVWRRFTTSNTSVARGLHGLSTGPPRDAHTSVC